MQKLVIIPEYRSRLHAYIGIFYKLSTIFLIQSKIHTNELNMFSFKGEAGYSDITLLWRLGWQIIVGQVTLISVAFPKLFSSLLFCAGHGIKCSRKIWKEDFEVLNSSQIFLYTKVIL